MPMVDPLIMEYDRESATTRKLLERVPDDKMDFRPHAKSYSLGQLANHIAGLPLFVASTLLSGFEGSVPKQEPAASSADLMATYDQGRTAVMTAMQALTDQDAMGMWSFKVAGQVVFELPRVALIRMLLLSHLIHHRGQLSVYLRLLDIPVPSIYGPSADENPFA